MPINCNDTNQKKVPLGSQICLVSLMSSKSLCKLVLLLKEKFAVSIKIKYA